MKIPLTLKRRSPMPRTAHLLLGTEIDLFDVCLKLMKQGECWPTIHLIEGGFLILVPERRGEPLPGGISLRCVEEGFYVPIDAELVPELLPDELAALTRNEGLVFLPGGRIYRFDRTRLVQPNELIELPDFSSLEWFEFPTSPDRPAGLHSIQIEMPDVPLLAGLADEIGENPILDGNDETSAKPSGFLGVLSDALGRLGEKLPALGFLSWVGKLLPALPEGILNKQERALEELLKQFRAGNIEEALRKAIPLNNNDSSLGNPSYSTELPTRDTRYRSGEFLQSSRGPIAPWGSGRHFEELEREYRRVAQQAARDGDFRRAAVIYGRLLQDWTNAALMLLKAGLHHDAAMVYLQKCFNPTSAAQAFEAAGEIDRALEIYVTCHAFHQAAELLLRVGEFSRAEHYFRLEAAKEAEKGNYLRAATILETRVGDHDGMQQLLSQGWTKHGGDSAGCVCRLIELFSDPKDAEKLAPILDEIDRHYRPLSVVHEVRKIYEHLAQTARSIKDIEYGEMLRDHALMGLSSKLRQRATEEQGVAGRVTEVFQPGEIWDSGLIRDAEVAVKAVQQKESRSRRRDRRFHLHKGTVRAACGARLTGEMFIAWEGGTVMRYSATGGTICLSQQETNILNLRCDETGDNLALLRATSDPKRIILKHFPTLRSSPGSQSEIAVQKVSNEDPVLLILGAGEQYRFGIYQEDQLDLYSHQICKESFVVGHGLFSAYVARFPVTYRSLILIYDQSVSFCVLQEEGTSSDDLTSITRILIRLPFSLPLGDWSYHEILAHSLLGSQLELLILDPRIGIRRLYLNLDPAEPGVLESATVRLPDPIRAATLVGQGRIVAVTDSGVHWFQSTETGLKEIRHTRAALDDAFACIADPQTNELLIVTGNGEVVRVAM